MVDIESDGPIPGDYSMLEFGAVIVDDKLDKTFYSGKIRPISNFFNPGALESIGYSRGETMMFTGDPKETMEEFAHWIKKYSIDKPMFISDNNGFDWMFICWYFHHFTNKNPFGHSSTNLGSLYKGMVKTMFKNFKHLRKTKHTHNPVDDAMGNAEAFLHMINKMELKT